ITTIRSAPRASAGLIGVFRRGPPSKYQPPAARGWVTRTAGETPGKAPGARPSSRGRRGPVLGIPPPRPGPPPPPPPPPHTPAVVEDDGVPAPRRGRDHRGGGELAAGDVGADALERDAGSQRARQRRGVQQAPQTRARQAEQLPEGGERFGQLGYRHERAQHVVEADLRPK